MSHNESTLPILLRLKDSFLSSSTSSSSSSTSLPSSPPSSISSAITTTTEIPPLLNAFAQKSNSYHRLLSIRIQPLTSDTSALRLALSILLAYDAYKLNVNGIGGSGGMEFLPMSEAGFSIEKVSLAVGIRKAVVQKALERVRNKINVSEVENAATATPEQTQTNTQIQPQQHQQQSLTLTQTPPVLITSSFNNILSIVHINYLSSYKPPSLDVFVGGVVGVFGVFWGSYFKTASDKLDKPDEGEVSAASSSQASQKPKNSILGLALSKNASSTTSSHRINTIHTDVMKNLSWYISVCAFIYLGGTWVDGFDDGNGNISANANAQAKSSDRKCICSKHIFVNAGFNLTTAASATSSSTSANSAGSTKNNSHGNHNNSSSKEGKAEEKLFDKILKTVFKAVYSVNGNVGGLTYIKAVDDGGGSSGGAGSKRKKSLGGDAVGSGGGSKRKKSISNDKVEDEEDEANVEPTNEQTVNKNAHANAPATATAASTSAVQQRKNDILKQQALEMQDNAFPMLPTSIRSEKYLSWKSGVVRSHLTKKRNNYKRDNCGDDDDDDENDEDDEGGDVNLGNDKIAISDVVDLIIKQRREREKR